MKIAMTSIQSIIIILILSLKCSTINAQEQKSISTTDWFTYKYKFLDADLKPTVTSDQFEKWKTEFRFRPDNIMDCSDSLKVILSNELQNAQDVRTATLHLCYTWERASWSVLIPAEELKIISHNAGIKRPYKLVEELRSSTNNNLLKQRILSGLNDRLKQVIKDTMKVPVTTENKMKMAFRYSPARLKVVDSILKSQGSFRKPD